MDPHDVKMEDLPESYRDIAELIGLDNALKLVERCGGLALYIPKAESCLLAAKCRQIYDEWRESTSGNVYAELAKKHNYTETHVRRIIRDMSLERSPRRKQMELF